MEKKILIPALLFFLVFSMVIAYTSIALQRANAGDPINDPRPHSVKMLGNPIIDPRVQSVKVLSVTLSTILDDTS